MPAYNAAPFISESIDSVLHQTYKNFELIIVNDCSTDNTSSILNYYSDISRVVIINLETNSGVAEARNIGIKHASGRFISFLDSDDLWERNKLEYQVKLLLENNEGCCHSDYQRITENGEYLSIVRGKERVTFNDMLITNEIGNLTGIYDTRVVGKVYQKKIGHEDYLMWLDVLRLTSSIRIRIPLAKYRVRSSSLSGNKIKAVAWHYKILRQQIGFRPFLLTRYMFLYIVSALGKRV